MSDEKKRKKKKEDTEKKKKKNARKKKKWERKKEADWKSTVRRHLKLSFSLRLLHIPFQHDSCDQHHLCILQMWKDEKRNEKKITGERSLKSPMLMQALQSCRHKRKSGKCFHYLHPWKRRKISDCAMTSFSNTGSKALLRTPLPHLLLFFFSFHFNSHNKILG